MQLYHCPIPLLTRCSLSQKFPVLFGYWDNFKSFTSWVISEEESQQHCRNCLCGWTWTEHRTGLQNLQFRILWVYTSSEMEHLILLFAHEKENVLLDLLLDSRLSIWNIASQVYLLRASLLQWNLTELITYLKVLLFHSYTSNEFLPVTSSFLSIALSLILSHLYYLTILLQDKMHGGCSVPRLSESSELL